MCDKTRFLSASKRIKLIGLKNEHAPFKINRKYKIVIKHNLIIMHQQWEEQKTKNEKLAHWQ